MKKRKPTSAKHPKPTPKQPAPPTTPPTSTTTTAAPSTTSTTILSTTQPTPSAPTATNALGQPGASLQKFSLADLAQFTREHTYSTLASKNFHLFYVGRDDVHSILKYVLSRVTVSLHLNMFGYDDDELNGILIAKMLDADVVVSITLDRQQADSSKHEQELLALDRQKKLANYNTHFVIGTSPTHQISHTKGFVADGIVAAEGSTNWSTSGEGTFIVTGQAGGPNYKAQNNTQSIITDIDTVTRFQSELISEHLAAQQTAKDNAVAEAAKGAAAKKK